MSITQENGFFVSRYQPVDRDGNNVGPEQIFKDKTMEGLVEKLTKSNASATQALWETRKAVKLEELITPDKEEPILTFEERQFTADDRIRLAREMQDPTTAVAAVKELVEGTLGAPLPIVRQKLREQDVRTRVLSIQQVVAQFNDRHPEYVPNAANRMLMQKYLEKHTWAITPKNLDLAFNALHDSLILSQPDEEETETQESTTTAQAAPVITAQTEATVEAVSEAPVPEPQAVITPTVTPKEPIRSAGPKVQNRLTPPAGSTGLPNSRTAARPIAKPLTAGGYTREQISKMSASEYAEAMLKPGFEQEMEKLFPPQPAQSRPR